MKRILRSCNPILIRPFAVFFLASLVFLAGSCNIINPAEVMPAYVRIDSFAFQGNTSISGSNSHRISSAFVYLNNQSVGIFDLPVTFPVILDKPGKLMMTPGINYNGMRTYQVQYPFYLSDSVTISPDTVSGATRVLVPVARYNPATKFPFLQNFENYLSAPFLDAGGDTTINVGTADDPLEGNYGFIVLKSDQDSSVNITRDAYALPVNSDVYLEMDYKSNIPLTVGLQTTVGGEVQRSYIIGLNPRATWGKIYIDLRTFVSTYQGGFYRLLIRAVRTPGVAEGRVQLDNIKMVHF